MRDDVVALYVDPRGPYPKLVKEWYDEKRDARTYEGPWPVVAHPPCGPRGSCRNLCTKQDASLAIRAIDQIRRFGGVLEHPAGSKLFGAHLPKPGDGIDFRGGQSYFVRQVAWGHACVKPTWLYVVGVPFEQVILGIRHGGVPTHRVANSRGDNRRLLAASAQIRRRTPTAFAEWLVSLAAHASLCADLRSSG